MGRTRTLGEEGGAPKTTKPKMCQEMGQVSVPPLTAQKEKMDGARMVLQKN